MKRISLALACAAMLLGTGTASAQYYEIANQLTGLISPALSGSFRYKGYVDVSGTAGLGENRANFIGVSTSQGYQYASWFFMGVGIGVDVAMAHNNNDVADALPPDSYPDYFRHNVSTTKCMIPVFSDFRFNIGPASSTSFFADLKVGAAWLLGNSYLQMEKARMTSQTQFYFKPTVGVRLPINSANTRQAINIGVTYQLLTSNNNYNWYSNSVTLNNLGLTIAYEW